MALTCYYCNCHSLEDASNCIKWPVVTTGNRQFSYRNALGSWASPVAQMVKNLPAMREIQI